MQKKRVGVITFHNYDNYGAILQSYALQKKLQEIGTQPFNESLKKWALIQRLLITAATISAILSAL